MIELVNLIYFCILSVCIGYAIFTVYLVITSIIDSNENVRRTTLWKESVSEELKRTGDELLRDELFKD